MQGGRLSAVSVAFRIGALDQNSWARVVGADVILRKFAQRRAGPAADSRPALGRDMSGNPVDCGSFVESSSVSRTFVGDEAADLESIPAVAIRA